MKTFKLGEHTIELHVTYGATLRIKEHAGIDILGDEQPDGDKPRHILSELLGNEDSLMRAVFATCMTELKNLEIDWDKFVDLVDGKTFQDAVDAFTRDLIDFFRQRGHGHKAAIVEEILSTVAQVMPEAEKAIREAANQAKSAALSSVSRESSASTPATGRSEISTPPQKVDSVPSGPRTPS